MIFMIFFLIIKLQKPKLQSDTFMVISKYKLVIFMGSQSRPLCKIFYIAHVENNDLRSLSEQIKPHMYCCFVCDQFLNINTFTAFEKKLRKFSR